MKASAPNGPLLPLGSSPTKKLVEPGIRLFQLLRQPPARTQSIIAVYRSWWNCTRRRRPGCVLGEAMSYHVRGPPVDAPGAPGAGYNGPVPMLKRLYWINAALLATHEVDSAYWKEWRVFHLPFGLGGFVLLHIALFLLAFWASNRWCEATGRTVGFGGSGIRRRLRARGTRHAAAPGRNGVSRSRFDFAARRHRSGLDCAALGGRAGAPPRMNGCPRFHIPPPCTTLSVGR